MHLKSTIQSLAAAALASGLVACSGADDRAPRAQADADRGAVATAAIKADPIPPLMDDDGNMMPSSPQSVPSDAGARTRAMRYASAAQAEMLEHVRPGEVLRVNVTGSGAEAVELGVRAARARQVDARLAHDAPVFVSGDDLRSAAIVVDRLGEQGMTRVWLVTP
jgi:hypothetical protein